MGNPAADQRPEDREEVPRPVGAGPGEQEGLAQAGAGIPGWIGCSRPGRSQRLRC